MDKNGKQLLVVSSRFKSVRQMELYIKDVAPDKETNIAKRFDNAFKTLKYYSGGKAIRKNGTIGIALHMEYYAGEKSRLEINKWVQINKNWVIRYFGTSRDTLLFSNWEDTKDGAHMDIILIPTDAQDKINASVFIHSRTDLRRMQDSYADEMKRMCGLLRLPSRLIQHKAQSGVYKNTLSYADTNSMPVQEADESDSDYILRLTDYTTKLKLSYEEKLQIKNKPVKDNTSKEDPLMKEYMELLSVYGNAKTIRGMLETSRKLQNGIKAYKEAGHPEIVGQVQKILGYGEQYMAAHGIK